MSMYYDRNVCTLRLIGGSDVVGLGETEYRAAKVHGLPRPRPGWSNAGHEPVDMRNNFASTNSSRNRRYNCEIFNSGLHSLKTDIDNCKLASKCKLCAERRCQALPCATANRSLL